MIRVSSLIKIEKTFLGENAKRKHPPFKYLQGGVK